MTYDKDKNEWLWETPIKLQHFTDAVLQYRYFAYRPSVRDALQFAPWLFISVIVAAIISHGKQATYAFITKMYGEPDLS